MSIIVQAPDNAAGVFLTRCSNGCSAGTRFSRNCSSFRSFSSKASFSYLAITASMLPLPWPAGTFQGAPVLKALRHLIVSLRFESASPRVATIVPGKVVVASAGQVLGWKFHDLLWKS